MSPEASDADRPTNRLGGESSPYLLQHAHNPVDWYPWGPEAFERARQQDRPVLVSIGYAACHWCHVMERESFEDPDTAALMNEHFVSIKVDREERPDVDAIYMDAVQAMTGSGGWPLTAFLTPDGEPFYAGTYFPNEDRLGMPAFRRVLTAIADTWRDRRDEVETQGRRLVEAIARPALAGGDEAPGGDVLSDAFTTLRRSFDQRWGGFGGAPKFPQTPALEFVIRAQLRGFAEAPDVLTTTLDRMAAGGVYDQVGGGFHRYSVDERWHVPHFEKMLYDNAQLLRVYVRAWQVTRRDAYERVARETAEYLLREMRRPEGGFASSQDADTDGVEGRTYVWDYDDIAGLVGPAVAAAFGATPAGNWESVTNVLWRPHPIEAVAAELGVDEEALRADVEEARRPLREARDRRPQPALDDKVVAGWNGLAIGALAEAGRALGVQAFVDAATGAAAFVTDALHDEEGRLLRSWRAGRRGPRAFADDHALLAGGLLTLFETTFDLAWFSRARELCDRLLTSFADDERGGFFQTPSDAAGALVVRPKDLFDNAVPSGNSAAADALLRMALLTGEADYERAAERALAAVGGAMAQAPAGFGTALCALDRLRSRPLEVAIVGDPASERTRALVAEVTTERFLPNHVLAVAAPDGDAAAAVPLLRNRLALDGAPTAYVCERFVCKLPVREPADLAALLAEG